MAPRRRIALTKLVDGRDAQDRASASGIESGDLKPAPWLLPGNQRVYPTGVEISGILLSNGSVIMDRWSSRFRMSGPAFVSGLCALFLWLSAFFVFGQAPQPQSAPAALAKCQQCHG